MNKHKIFLLLLIGIISFSDISSQTSLPLPSHASTFTGLTRGYFFTAPSDFVITSLRVPTDASSAAQSIAVVRFNTTNPPAFPGTTLDYTTLHLTQGLNTTTPVAVSILVKAGDIIGVLGSRGSNSTNSYGQPNPFNTTLLGGSVSLTRMGIQADLESNFPFGIWTEAFPPSNDIGRVEMTVEGITIPTLGQWGILVLLLSLSIVAIVAISAYSKLGIKEGILNN